MSTHKELTTSDKNDFKLLCLTYSVGVILLLSGSVLFFSSGLGHSSNVNIESNVTNPPNTTSPASGANFDLKSSIVFFVLGGITVLASAVFCARNLCKFFGPGEGSEMLLRGRSVSSLDFIN